MKCFIFIFLLLSFTACLKEDERASDFEIRHELKDQKWKSQWVEGTIQNISSTPADKVKIRMRTYQDRSLADTRIVRIKGMLFAGEVAEFCETVGDTISRVELIIVKVE
jgi:hypothetical protein